MPNRRYPPRGRAGGAGGGFYPAQGGGQYAGQDGGQNLDGSGQFQSHHHQYQEGGQYLEGGGGGHYRVRGGGGFHYNDRGGGHYQDRGGRQYHDRGDGQYHDRGGGQFHDRGGGHFHDRGGGHFHDRGGGHFHDRGGGHFHERGGGHYRDRGSGQYRERGVGGGGQYRGRGGGGGGYHDRGYQQSQSFQSYQRQPSTDGELQSHSYGGPGQNFVHAAQELSDALPQIPPPASNENEEDYPDDDFDTSKKGTSGVEEEVITNYFIVNRSPNFVLNGYRVDFEPPELDDTRLKRQLMNIHKGSLGNFMFDGHTLYTGSTIPKHLELLESVNAINQQKFAIKLRLVSQIRPDEKVYLQFHNIAFRSMLEKIGMEQIGRHYYDRNKAICMEEERLDLWPGVTTSIREHEAGMLLCVELTHKILRRETAFDVMSAVVKSTVDRARSRNYKPDVNAEVSKELLNCIVLTHYNRRTYRIDEIAFDKSPLSEFTLDDGSSVSYVKYYKDRWNIDITGDSLNQPLLVSNPRRKDQNKGVTGPIYLIPSLCFMTGLTEDMRKNFQLTRKLGVHLHMAPADRKKKLDEFIRQFSRPEIKAEFDKWNFEFGTSFVPAPVRVLPPEQIQLGTQNSLSHEWFQPDKAEDWTNHFKRAGLLVPVNIPHWIMYAPYNEAEREVQDFIETLIRAGKRLGCRMQNPVVIKYDGRRAFDANEFVQSFYQIGKDNQLVLYVLPGHQGGSRYNDVKRACTLQLKVVSQCFQSRNLRNRNLISICQKMVIQMNAKLRGEPWAVKMPISNSMILGFDAFRCTTRKDSHVGALVGSMNKNCTRYFSTVSFHADKAELSLGLNANILKCLAAYQQVNQKLPTRIILFRDGVGDGQIEQVLQEEVRQIQVGIKRFYEEHGRMDGVRLAVIIVTKKINTRYLLEERGTWTNPSPGTILDGVVTLPDRYDYFLVSQTVRQGTVSPTNYNVISDNSGIGADGLQVVTYKLCHLYFNWSGSVAVPAPCQYAHKLAQITGSALAEEAPYELSHNLWYL